MSPNTVRKNNPGLVPSFFLPVPVRTLVSSVKTKVVSDELLVVLGSRDERWAVLDEVAARNLQKGLVTFELTESFDRFSTQLPFRRLDIEIYL